MKSEGMKLVEYKTAAGIHVINDNAIEDFVNL